MASYDSLITRDFDSEFSALNINFYPWVGVDYGRRHRLLVVSKWYHDGNNPNGNAGTNIEYGRETLYTKGISAIGYPYENSLNLLCVAHSHASGFWKRVAFCNIAVEQRKMNDSAPLCDSDYQAFAAILNILEPTHILFVDVALRYFKTAEMLAKAGVEVSAFPPSVVFDQGNICAEVVELSARYGKSTAVFTCDKKYKPMSTPSNVKDFFPKII